MSSKCTAAKAYDILGIYDFPDNFDALNGLHSYLYTTIFAMHSFRSGSIHRTCMSNIRTALPWNR